MIDLEKVIKGLKCCKNKNILWNCELCPYHGFEEDCENRLHMDALALLNIIYINTKEEAHSIEVGEDGLPY